MLNKQEKPKWIRKKEHGVYSRINAIEDTHDSLKSQKETLGIYAQQMDFEVVESSEDLGSGLDFNRKGLEYVFKFSCFMQHTRYKPSVFVFCF